MKFDIDNIKNKIEQDDNYVYFYSSKMDYFPLWSLDEICNQSLSYFSNFNKFLQNFAYCFINQPFVIFKYKVKKDFIRNKEFENQFIGLPIEIDKKISANSARKLIMLYDFK